MKAHPLISGAVALTAALLVAGCGSSGDAQSSTSSSSTSSSSSSPSASPSASGSADATAAMVTIKNFRFTVSGAVQPGAKVMVKNEDSEAHTVTADSKGGFDVKVDPGATATFTAPSAAGSYPFHCTFHSDMHGTLKVG